jgi:hypothetical protein
VGEVVTPAVCDPKSDEALDTLIGLATDYAGWTEQDARYLIDKIDRIQEAGTWPKRLKGGPKTWERFCSQVLKYDSDYFDRIRDGIQVLESKGIHRPTIGQAERAVKVASEAEAARMAAMENAATDPLPHQEIGNGKSGPGRGNKTGVINTRFVRGSSNVDYLAARIARDHPDILKRMKAGEYRSVLAAAKDAGIVKEKIQVPKEPEGAARLLLKHFGAKQIKELIRLLSEGLK